MQVIDPSTGEAGAVYTAHDEAEVERRLAQAQRAFEGWRDRPFADRAELLSRAAAQLRVDAGTHAILMAQEMGKPVTQGRAEVEKCASLLEHYAAHGAAYLASEIIQTEARASFVAYRPLGVLLAVMPWNFPFWQVIRQVGPALMAGNASVLKHAENVPGCALALEALFREAGAPEGLFTTLLLPHARLEPVIRDRRIKKISLTGSDRAGRAVAAAAGAALKPTVLELGGSDAYLVLEDADLDLAARECAKSRLLNGGQSCIAAKRFIVVEPVREAFTERLVAHLRAARMGPALDDATELGPQARADLRAALHRQVEASVASGARLCLGGALPEGPGFYYPATVLDRVTPGMAVADEETFGPVAAVLAAKDEAHAIALANQSVFGLGGCVFTRDLARGQEIAERRLEVGAAFVNALVRSDARLPFGGIGDSGYGRELGRHGILELTNAKTVFVA